MKSVLAVVVLVLGMVLGFAAGMAIRGPEVLSDPTTLLPEDAPDACLEVIEAAEQLAQVTRDYLSLVQDTYLPVIEQYTEHGASGQETAAPSPGASEVPVVDELLSADQQLADLSDRTVAATAALNEDKVLCRSQTRE